MADGVTKRHICSSIVEKNGKYGALIHDDTGRVLVEPDCRFDTMDEARKAGTAILNKGAELMRKEGHTVYRPGNPGHHPPARTFTGELADMTFVYIPTQAAIEPVSQGLFVTERIGPLPADFRVYTLRGFLEEPPRIWKESPESVEWLFAVTMNNEIANLHDPAVFATLSEENAVILRAIKQ